MNFLRSVTGLRNNGVRQPLLSALQAVFHTVFHGGLVFQQKPHNLQSTTFDCMQDRSIPVINYAGGGFQFRPSRRFFTLSQMGKICISTFPSMNFESSTSGGIRK